MTAHGTDKDHEEDRYRYEIVLCRSDDDDACIAEVPELPGCAADGASCTEAIRNAEVVIDERAETAMEVGRPVPGSRGRRLMLA